MNQKIRSSVVSAKFAAAALTVGAFLLAACAAGQESGDVTARLALPFELGVEQTAVIESEDLSLTFMEVSEDSRCPTGVECVWEGQVTTLISVSIGDKDAGEHSLTLREGQEDMTSAVIEGYVIELLAVDPYPTVDEPAGSADYSASYVVSK